MSRDLTDKVVVVVGASSGMGEACAHAFADAGARVVLSARRSEVLEQVAKEIKQTGGQAVAHAVDVNDRDQIAGLITRANDTFGPVDILIYAAGTNIPQRAVEKLSYEDWNAVLTTNLTGAFSCTQAVLPQMLDREDGLIMYLSSGAAKWADASGVSYQASKRGLDGLAQGVMQEIKGRGVRTTVIYPGLCDTPMLLKRPTPTPAEIVAKALQPEDVAETCLFVAGLPSRVHVPEMVVYPAGI